MATQKNRNRLITLWRNKQMKDAAASKKADAKRKKELSSDGNVDKAAQGTTGSNMGASAKAATNVEAEAAVLLGLVDPDTGESVED